MKLLLTVRVQLGHAEQLFDRTVSDTVSYLQQVVARQLPYCSVLADKAVCGNRSNSASGTTRLKPTSAS